MGNAQKQGGTKPAGKPRVPSLGRKPGRWKTFLLGGAVAFGLGCSDDYRDCDGTSESTNCTIQEEGKVRCVIEMAYPQEDDFPTQAGAAMRIDDIFIVITDSRHEVGSEPKVTIGILDAECNLIATIDDVGEGKSDEIRGPASKPNVRYRITVHAVGMSTDEYGRTGSADVEVERIER